MNINLNIKIIFLTLLVLITSHVLASSINSSSSRENEQKKIPYFYLNEAEVISQNGETIGLDISYPLALVNLSIDGNEPLDLMINYYEIQKVLLMKDLHIKELEYKRFGQIKIQTDSHKLIKFQDFQLSDQLITLKTFFQSKESENLLKNFKTIDLRHKNKLAIGYY